MKASFSCVDGFDRLSWLHDLLPFPQCLQCLHTAVAAALSRSPSLSLTFSTLTTSKTTGDWDKAWEIFETQFPVDDPNEFPSLEELLAWDPDADEKTARRQREKSIQEEYARARVQRIDEHGRAHAVGKRKTSVARVWIKEGSGLIMINRKPFDQYFPALPRRNDLIAPLLVTNLLGKFDIMGIVHGG